MQKFFQQLPFISTQGRRTGVRSFPAFEGLRGYMAWWVVIGHAINLCGLRGVVPAILNRADVAVNIFIILSGFVICHLALEKEEPYPVYIKRRAFRILPIYFFCLVCALMATTAYDFAYQSEWVYDVEGKVTRAQEIQKHFGTHLLLHVSMLHGLVPDTVLPYSASSLLAPAWSLSLEWQFYLVAPFFVFLLAKQGRTRIISVAVILAIVLAFKKIVPLDWQYPSALPLALHFFMVGILSRVFIAELARYAGYVPLVGLALFLVVPPKYALEVAIWSVFLGAALLEYNDSVAPLDKGRSRNFAVRMLGAMTSNRFMAKVGQTSYSTYLIHIPLFAVSAYGFSKILGRWDQDVVLMSTVAAMLVLLPLGTFLYAYVEKPFIRWGALLTKPSGAVAHPI